MNSKLKLVFVSCALVFLGWTSSALALQHHLSTSYTVQGTYQGAFVPIVTQSGDTIFTKINFEGVGNVVAIGEIIPGVTFSPNCLGLVDADAGGSGNFANEPSPQTIAFFLADNGCTVTFAEPISGVSLFYTSSVPVTLRARDSAGTLLASAEGELTPFGGKGDPTGTFDTWQSLGVNVATNSITTVEIHGSDNQTGFDDFTFARKAFIEVNEAVSAEVLSEAGVCGSVRRILGARGRTQRIIPEEGSGCVTTQETVQITVDGLLIPGAAVFISPEAQVTFAGSHKFCWASTTTGQMTCVQTPPH